MSLEELKKSSRWLSQFAANVYSQTGEDGVLAKILSLLPNTDHWCVEFGAWDGKHLSNTFNLVEKNQYSVVLIEGNRAKYEKLVSDYPFQEQGHFVHQFVGWTPKDNLDSILGKQPIPRDFDLLSIDVDGNDYHIWQAMNLYRPKLVLIEFNPTSSNKVDYVQPADSSCNQGNSPAAFIRLGKEKGYELICVTGANLLFVDEQFYNLFNISDNSLEVMREEEGVTTLFMGFDGSVMADGPAHLCWHNEPLKLKQPLPKILRHYPPNYSKSQAVAYRLRSLKKRIFG
jgi:hypothetical protein